MNDKTELIEKPENAEQNVLSLIAQVATTPDANPDVMEKLLDMQERVLDRNAKQAFNAAFVQCQQNMPTIIKTTKNEQTGSFYAKLNLINEYLLPHINEFGFALSFASADSPLDEHIRITGELIHSEGHSKDYFLDFPHDGAGIKGNPNKTPIHARSSALTHGERRLTCSIFNIVLKDDDDGNSANSATKFTAGQFKEFKKLAQGDNATAYTLFCSAYSDRIEAIRKLYLEDFRSERTMTAEKHRLLELEVEGHKESRKTAEHIEVMARRQEISAIQEAFEECSEAEKKLIWVKLSGEAISYINEQMQDS